MRRLETTILTLICGAALGLPGCYASDERAGPGDPPADASADVMEDGLEDVEEEEGPPIMDMYGVPPDDTLYGPPSP